ncbi:hypothetical protein EDB85DRAFT_1998909, partial [Lactarius pseudohatsudake]
NGSASLTRRPGLGYEAGPLASSASASTTSGSVAYIRLRTIFMNTNTSRFFSVSQLHIYSSTSWRGPSQVVHIKHEHNVGLVANLVQLADVVPPRLLFHLAAPDRDIANRMSCMAVVGVSHASDERVGSDTIIESSFPGSRGEGWEDRISSGKVSE